MNVIMITLTPQCSVNVKDNFIDMSLGVNWSNISRDFKIEKCSKFSSVLTAIFTIHLNVLRKLKFSLYHFLKYRYIIFP